MAAIYHEKSMAGNAGRRIQEWALWQQPPIKFKPTWLSNPVKSSEIEIHYREYQIEMTLL